MEKSKALSILIISALLVFLIAMFTYRITMRSMQIHVDGRYAYVTVYGQTDRYLIDK